MGKRIKYSRLIWVVLLALAAVQGILYSQRQSVRPSREIAMEAFGRGEYNWALDEFESLLEIYSFPIYKYYSAVCLVNMNSDPEKAIEYLDEALSYSGGSEIIPDDAWFYLGRAYQLEGRFPEAADAYDTFTEKAGRKKARGMNVAKYLKECRELTGSLGPEKSSGRYAVEGSSENVLEKQLPVKLEVPAAYDSLLSEVMKYQVMADSLYAIATGYRKQYDRLSPVQQREAAAGEAKAKALAGDYQRMADEKFGFAGIHTSTPVSQQIDQEKPRQVPIVVSLFRVESDPAGYGNQNISYDPETPAGLVYRIQVGVFSKPVDLSFFKGITPVYGFTSPGKSSVRYYAGMFRMRKDAEKSLTVMKQMGFRDAFLTAVLDDKPVSLERALLMEGEWSNKSLQETEVQAAKPSEPATLSFRVEVTRSVKPLDEETTGLFRTMAGNRGFDIIQAEDESLVYLIGKFITFESASEYADLLRRNGYSEAKVVAYVGNREIPLETAKELFEE